MRRSELKVIQGRGGLRVDHWQRVQRAKTELENLPYFDPREVQDGNRGDRMLRIVMIYAFCVFAGGLILAWVLL